MKRLFVLCVFVGALFGVDYSKMSNEDLVRLSGKVEPKEIVSYFSEIAMRMEKMTQKEARAMRLEMRKMRQKAEENLTLKEWRAKNEAICNELRVVRKNERFMMKMARAYCKQAKQNAQDN